MKYLSAARVTLLKELRVIFRERRALFNILLIPLITVPLMLFVGNVALRDQQKLSEGTVVGVQGPSTEFSSFIESQPNVRVVVIATAKRGGEMLRSGKIDVLLIGGRTDGGDESAQGVTAHYDGTALRSVAALSLVRELGGQYNSMANRLQVSESGAAAKITIDPLTLRPSDISSHDSTDFAMLAIVPMLIVLSVSIGAGGVSNSITVGEKEARTYESLLSTGAPSRGIALGKLLAIMIAGWLSGVSSILGLVLAKLAFRQFALNINVKYVFFAVALSAAVSMLFSVVYFSVGFLSKTYREAQSYTTVISLVSMVPTYFFSTTNTATMPSWYWTVPILNFTLAMRDGLNSIYRWDGISLCVAATFAVLGVVLVGVMRLSDNEAFIYQR